MLTAILKARFPVSGLALPSTSPHGTPPVQTPLDLLAAMDQICRPYDFTLRVVDQGESRHSAPWIDLEAQWLKIRLLHYVLEDYRERIPAVDRRLASFKQQASA